MDMELSQRSNDPLPFRLLSPSRWQQMKNTDLFPSVLEIRLLMRSNDSGSAPVGNVINHEGNIEEKPGVSISKDQAHRNK